MGFFSRIFQWIEQLFENAEKDLLKASVLITQDIKPILDSPVTDVLASIADAVTKSQLPTEILGDVKKAIPVFLAETTLLTSITPDMSEDQIKAILDKMVSEWPNVSVEKKGELFTSLTAKIFMLASQLAKGQKVTFGEAASLVESAYQTWVNASN